jgi:hypothetical protein
MLARKVFCSICNSPEPDTWKHVLLSCTQPHIHPLRVKRHNKAVWELQKLITQYKQSCSFILMNAGTFNEAPPDNTLPPWLLECTCQTSRYHCHTRFKPDFLYIQDVPYKNLPPIGPNPAFTIQFIEVTYCNDRFSLDTILSKINKYQPLIDTICTKGWSIAPLMVITASVCATTHIPSMTLLHDQLKIPQPAIKQACININTIAKHHAMSILLYKRKLENNQSLPISYDPP